MAIPVKKQLKSLNYVKNHVIERRKHEIQKGLHCDEIIGVPGGTTYNFVACHETKMFCSNMNFPRVNYYMHPKDIESLHFYVLN